MAKRTCSVEGCDRPHKGNGYCNTHYSQAKLGKTPGAIWDRQKGSCSVEGCDGSHSAKGLCRLHYMRWLSTGSTTASRAKAPSGAPEAFIEMAVSYVGDDCLIWPYAKSDRGYGTITRSRDFGCKFAHTEVLCRVTGHRPEGLQAAHAPLVCHERACVNPAHLRWATLTENQADRVLDGTSLRTLTDDEVRAIRADSRRQVDIAADYGIAQSQVSAIKLRKLYASVPDVEEGA